MDASLVDLAKLEALASGTQLTPGQIDLVRDMACSGGRVQLAIAPAGTGKTTTAVRVLGSAWTESGGTVIGLAPSAAAAKALVDSSKVPCDTLAKLTWSLDHVDVPRGRSKRLAFVGAALRDPLLWVLEVGRL